MTPSPRRRCARVERVFGLVSLSPGRGGARRDGGARPRPPCKARRPRWRAIPRRRRSFRIEARRSDKRFPVRSTGDRRARWARRSTWPPAIPVDLHHPALTIGVEVGHRRRLRLRRDAARPGRPAGGHRRARRCCCCRAASIRRWRAGWRPSAGWRWTALYFHSPPFVGEKSKDKVVTLARALGRWQALRRLLRGQLHRGPEAPARGRPGRAGGGAVPPHDDARGGPDGRPHGGRRRWSPARTWARSPARP